MPDMRLPAAAAVALALAAAAPAALAEPAGTRLAQAESYSDAQLDSFAVAAIEVSKVRNEYIPRIQSAESEADKQALAQEATDRMIAAVDSAPGISVDEYNAIAQAAGEDPELAERLRQHIEAAQ